MIPEFHEILIGDVCSVGDGAHSKVKRVDVGVPYLTSKNIGQGDLKLDKLNFISKESFEKLFPKNSKAVRRPQAGDVLFGIIGTFGNAYLFKESDHFGFSSSIGILRSDPKKLYAEYLYYVVSSKVFKNNHANHNAGSVQGYTNIPTVKSLPIPLPPLAEQKRIAKVLKSLDNKIKLNCQTNQTLEQIAQAIFKSWFVDFDPVKAKIKAKKEWAEKSTTKGGENDKKAETLFIERAAMCAISGKSLEQLEQLSVETQQQLKTTAALFPDALVDSELGEIPDGWEPKTFLQMVELIGGGTPKRSEHSFWNGDIPWFSVKDSPQDGDVFVIETMEKITELGLNKSSTKLLPEGVTIISARGTVGKLALVGVPTAMNQSCYGVKGAREIGPYLNYFNLKQVLESLKQNTHGAVFDTITKDTFNTVELIDSTDKIKKVFDVLVSPLFKTIKNNLFESRNFEKMRDTLLPKLLSGELTLPPDTIKEKLKKETTGASNAS